MSGYDHCETDRAPFEEENYHIAGLEDEIRADRLCRRLLEHFYLERVQEGELPAEEASALAYGADYFLREFVIGELRENILTLSAGRIRLFAGNWYIVKTLEPNLVELHGILEGVAAFYAYCARQELVPAPLAEEIRRQAQQLDYFRSRIESFWNLQGDAYPEWEAECSLKNEQRP